MIAKYCYVVKHGRSVFGVYSEKGKAEKMKKRADRNVGLMGSNELSYVVEIEMDKEIPEIG